MAMNAMGLRGAKIRKRQWTTFYVFRSSNKLKMLGIDAAPHSAQMINFFIRWNFTFVQNVTSAMRQRSLATKSK
jgi:hypothetical protein